VIRVLIVDDSALVRKVLTVELSKYPDIEIVGSAMDPYVARDKIVRLRPDVITLDLEMPRMNGLTFLAKLMKYYPLPVVVLSSLTPQNSDAAIRALGLGAIEVICKPGSAYRTPEVSRQLIQAIRAAASARIRKQQGTSETSDMDTEIQQVDLRTTHKVIAIGASTGGTQAIESVLKHLPATSPGTLIVQHMPEQFTTTFAQRLNQICQMEVREAQDNDHAVPGVALVAPGNRHMLLQQDGARYLTRIKNGPAVNHQRPSVDVLFQSVARSAGSNAIGVLLTGMGADGAKGLLAMREKGAYTLAQDEETCIVFGMPREAIRLGAVDDVVPIQHIPQAIINFLQRQEKGVEHV
jgi:two-component system chemotaxis response regulator CheB